MTDFTDLVNFEIADLAAAVRLLRRLAQTWTVTLNERRDVSLVTACLRAESEDLALLLRNVEAWVKEESLCAIRFELDAREYVLSAGEADWRSAPQTHCV